MSVAAIVPVKRFGAAKQRLAGSLQSGRRRRLVEAMLADVLGALAACATLDPTIVVTGEPAAVDAARDAGAEVVADPLDAGHSEAALLGVARALDAGVERCALLPGDCPLLDSAEVEAALLRTAREGVVVIPDRHGTGTNGLLLRPPDAIAPAFGEGSRARHEALARAAGHRLAVEPLPSLALDVDGPEDLVELQTALERAPRRARRTAEALSGLANRRLASDAPR